MPPKIIPKKLSRSKDSKNDDLPEVSVDPVLVVSQDLDDYDSLSNMSSQWVYGSPNVPSSLEPTNDRVMIVSSREKAKGEQSHSELILIPKLDFKKIDKYRQYAKDFAGVKEKNKAKAEEEQAANQQSIPIIAPVLENHAVHAPQKSQLHLQNPTQKPVKPQPIAAQQPLLLASVKELPQTLNRQTSQQLSPPNALVNNCFFVGFGVLFLVALLDLFAWNQAFASLNTAFGKMVASLVGSSSLVMILLYPAEQLIFVLSVVPGFSIYKVYLVCLSPKVVGPFFLMFIWDAILKNGIFMGIQFLTSKVKWRQSLLRSQKFSILATMLDKEIAYAIMFHFNYLPEYALLILGSVLVTSERRWIHLAALNGSSLIQITVLSILHQDGWQNLTSFAGLTGNFSKPFSGILFMLMSYLRFALTVGYFVVVVLRKSASPMPASVVMPANNNLTGLANSSVPGNNQSTKSGGLLAKRQRLQSRNPPLAGNGSKDGPKNHDDSEMNMVHK